MRGEASPKTNTNIEVATMNLRFNQNGIERMHQFVGRDKERLEDLKGFLDVISGYGIYLEQETFDKILKDMRCRVFDVTGEEEIEYMLVPLKGDQQERIDDATKALDTFVANLEDKNIFISEKTISLIEAEIAGNDDQLTCDQTYSL